VGSLRNYGGGGGGKWCVLGPAMATAASCAAAAGAAGACKGEERRQTMK